MRSYSYVKMMVDGKETSSLDIYREWNTFTIYEYDECVFRGSYGEAIQFIENWKSNKSQIQKFLETSGHSVRYEQTIK